MDFVRTLTLFTRAAKRFSMFFFRWARRFQRETIVAGLTTSLPVRAACLAVVPAVLLTQVAKGLAYPVNGVIMGKTRCAAGAAILVCVRGLPKAGRQAARLPSFCVCPAESMRFPALVSPPTAAPMCAASQAAWTGAFPRWPCGWPTVPASAPSRPPSTSGGPLRPAARRA